MGFAINSLSLRSLRFFAILFSICLYTFPVFIYPIQISIQQNSQKFNKLLPHIKWDEVRKQPRCECLTFPCLIVRGTIAGSGGGSRMSRNLFYMSNPHIDEANKMELVVFFSITRNLNTTLSPQPHPPLYSYAQNVSCVLPVIKIVISGIFWSTCSYETENKFKNRCIVKNISVPISKKTFSSLNFLWLSN